MKLHDNQLHLLRHLARFNLLDYQGCLYLLETPEVSDRVALSYAFRPLTKNGYLSKRKDGSVSILAKGRALFPDSKPLISAGGGAQSIQRVIEVSRIATLILRDNLWAGLHLTKRMSLLKYIILLMALLRIVRAAYIGKVGKG